MPRKGPTFKTRVKALGYCCPYSFVRINVGPNDTITKLALKAKVTERNICQVRAKVRDGKLRCENNDKCLKACWIEPPKVTKTKFEDAIIKAEGTTYDPFPPAPKGK